MILSGAILGKVGIPAWLWFVIAIIAAIAGVLLLLRERGQQHSADRERRRWSSLRGWQYREEDEALLDAWQGGAIAYYGADVAVDVVAGSTFTSDGRRPIFVFDTETDGMIDVTVAAVRCRRVVPALVELWLPSVPFQRDQMPDLLGPVGQRYAFVSDVNVARSMITRDLVDAVGEVGDDVTVVWLENDWVLAAVAPNASPARLERLLRDLGAVADLIDPFDKNDDPGRHADPALAGQGSPSRQQQPAAAPGTQQAATPAAAGAPQAAAQQPPEQSAPTQEPATRQEVPRQTPEPRQGPELRDEPRQGQTTNQGPLSQR